MLHTQRKGAVIQDSPEKKERQKRVSIRVFSFGLRKQSLSKKRCGLVVDLLDAILLLSRTIRRQQSSGINR